MEIDLTILNCKDGMLELMSSLDDLYEQDTIALTFSDHTEFDSFNKSESTGMTDPIIEYKKTVQ